MTIPSTDAAGANVAAFVSAKDVQVDALRAVIAANMRVALDTTFDQELAGVAVAETFGYPITLDLLMRSRLPALSVFRPTKSLMLKGRKQQRGSNFIIRWWVGAIPLMKLDTAWPFLDMAFEVIVETIVGHAMLDLAETNADGEVVCIPSNSVLHDAGILEVDRNSFRATFDFATSRDGGDAGMVYPVLDVSFNATTESTSKGYPYDPDSLDDLTSLFASLIEGDTEEGETGRLYVQVLARTDGDRSTQNDADFIIGEDGECTKVVETHATPIED